MSRADRTTIGMILNEPEGKIRFRYQDDGPVRRLSNRLEVERIKRAERRAARLERVERARGDRGRGVEQER